MEGKYFFLKFEEKDLTEEQKVLQTPHRRKGWKEKGHRQEPKLGGQAGSGRYSDEGK